MNSGILLSGILVGTMTVASLVPQGCAVPESYKKRMGWDKEDAPAEAGSSTERRRIDTYEKSLKAEYRPETRRWTVLNLMMRYLATELDKRERVTGNKPIIGDLMEKISSRDVVRDSAEIMGLYRLIFVDEDTRLTRGGGTNSFVDAVLMDRLDQVAMWGFDPLLIKLTVFGQFLTQHGPLREAVVGDSTIEGEMTLFSDEGKHTKYYVLAVENPKYLQYDEVRVFEGGKVVAPDARFDDLSGSIRASGGSNRLTDVKLEFAGTLSVPAAYEPLDVSRVLFTPIPSSGDSVWSPLDVTRPWIRRRIAIDIAVERKNLDGDHFTIRYAVYRADREVGDSTPVAQGEARYDIPSTSDRKGVSARLITEPIATDNTYEVVMEVVSGEKKVVRSEALNLRRDEFPLAVVREQERKPGLPCFYIGPVGQTMKLFVRIDGLGEDRERPGKYRAIGDVILTDSKVRLGDVFTGDSLLVDWNGAETKKPRPGRDPMKSPYGRYHVSYIMVEAAEERGMWTVDLALPPSARPGHTYMLSVEWFAAEPWGRRVLGTSSIPLQVK